MLHRLASLSAILTVSLFGTGAVAQQADSDSETDSAAIEQRIAGWLDRQDKDDDGQISEDEAIGLMKSNFARNDANQDGILDADELRRLSGRLQRNSQRPSNAQRQAGAVATFGRVCVDGVFGIVYLNREAPRHTFRGSTIQ